MSREDKFITAFIVAGLLVVAFCVVMANITGSAVRSECVGHETRAFTTNHGISTQYDPKCK